ncbi:Hypothetical protein SRAE_2000224800 [Strongyloides ratti]|uniref:Uncharacterized protein n=1 Tax=Strongyloides ratti TaxID=34506 RepID=A0A090LCS4_STRRB|nr:Hypothetical protein SRAE_2000224800 [Strongyloides ratti]CEF67586.1 Hypothetical protein SRAE_2000224800 [Strongyloides ratti]
MKSFILIFASVFIILINYTVLCDEIPSDENLGDDASKNEILNDNFNDNSNNEHSDDEGSIIHYPIENIEGTTIKTSTEKIQESSLKTTTRIITERTTTKHGGEGELSSTTSESTDLYSSTLSPCPVCPKCSTNFALGTFFFGNFFGMALMLVMGYIYLSWLRRASTIPSSARLY